MLPKSFGIALGWPMGAGQLLIGTVGAWILATGFWADAGAWDDTAFWKDS